jgi:hypothetical protein
MKLNQPKCERKGRMHEARDHDAVVGPDRRTSVEALLRRACQRQVSGGASDPPPKFQPARVGFRRNKLCQATITQK